MKTAYSLGYSGISLTDHETLSGHVEWLQTEKKLKEKGELPEDFKCGLGNEIYLVDDRGNIERYWHYILLAKDTVGHRALRELSSKAWYFSFSSRGMTRVPTEKKDLEGILRKYPNSLIATTACIGGELGGRILALEKLKAEYEMGDNSEENQKKINNLEEQINNFLIWNKNLFGDDFYIELAAGT